MACNEILYIDSATSLEEKLARYDQIIQALEEQMLNSAAGNSDIEEYQIDDGQVKIRTAYRDVKSIAQAIEAFTTLRQKVVNKLNGYGMVVRPWQGLRRRGGLYV